MDRATSSLPVPLSPDSRTLASVSATRRIRSSTRCRLGLTPTMASSRELGFDPVPQLLVLFSQVAQQQASLDRHFQLLHREGLSDEIACALPRRAQRGLHRRVGGDDQDGQAGLTMARPPRQLEPVLAGHHKVGDQQRERRRFEERLGLLGR